MTSCSGTKALVLAVFLVSSTLMVKAQDDFYDINSIQQIEISFTQSNWDFIMDTAKAGSGSYLIAQWVKINGVQFDSAGVKYKGSSSYDHTFEKNPLHISLDEFKNQSYQGITSIKLANFYGDPSMIREPLAYSILANYMDCPRANFATVTINGGLIGLYANDESVNKKFCSTHFYSSGNTFIKGSPELPGPFSKSNLKYISADSSDYFGKYTLESDHGWNDLVELCDIVTNQPEDLESVVDIDRALWMLAFNNVLVSLDSYSGWFSQNHYLYKDNTGHYNPVIWDLNMSFGGFPFAGSQNGGSGALTVTQMQQLSPELHYNHDDWPLISLVNSHPIRWRMYVAHMRTITEEIFANSSYIETAGMMHSLIDEAVAADPNKFFTYDEFQGSFSTDIQFGSYVIPGIQNLMDARAVYLSENYAFLQEPPEISSVAPSNPEPLLNEEVTINATVTPVGGPEVRLWIRFNKEDKFQELNMYDDGNHNDGAAGDNIYGRSFIMTSLIAQYYIYAENADAGKFSPENAEHEFYILTADIPTAAPGDVVINEFLAKNNLDTVNEYGNHEDWIELINLTDDPVDLFGLYLTDDYDDPVKFDFPENSIIEPGGYLMVWADEEDTVSEFLHANFKLSADGEKLMLSNGAGVVLDSLTFGPQTADISMGRCPDGSGSFSDLEFPTYDQTNYCPEGVSNPGHSDIKIIVMPNPVSDFVTIVTDLPDLHAAELFTSSGMYIKSEISDNHNIIFSTTDLPAGIYFFVLKDKNGSVLSSGKILKRN
jgi:hypothetical protein